MNYKKLTIYVYFCEKLKQMHIQLHRSVTKVAEMQNNLFGLKVSSVTYIPT